MLKDLSKRALLIKEAAVNPLADPKLLDRGTPPAKLTAPVSKVKDGVVSLPRLESSGADSLLKGPGLSTQAAKATPLLEKKMPKRTEPTTFPSTPPMIGKSTTRELRAPSVPQSNLVSSKDAVSLAKAARTQSASKDITNPIFTPPQSKTKAPGSFDNKFTPVGPQ